MAQCKDCLYWHKSDVTKLHSWGDCHYYVINKSKIPIHMQNSDCAPILNGDLKGYTSPTQENCQTFYPRRNT